MKIKYTLLLLGIVFITNFSYSQTVVCEGSSCTANDYTLDTFYLGDASGVAFGPGYCEPGTTVNAHIWTNFNANSVANRYSLCMHFNLFVNGVYIATMDECYYNGLPIPTNVELDLLNFDWDWSDDLFVGLSSPRLVSYTNETDITYEAIERASYYLTGGYMLEFNPQLKFKPTALIKYTNGAPISVDLTANFLIKEKLWLGTALRFNDAAGGYVSVLATDALRIGYSYEFSISSVRPYTSGSHEIFISYEFELPKSRCNCANKF